MLSSRLTMDDEEAVQAELKELQMGSVSLSPLTRIVSLSTLTYAQQLQETERQRIDLPSVPTTEPTVPVVSHSELFLPLSFVRDLAMYNRSSGTRKRSSPCTSLIFW